MMVDPCFLVLSESTNSAPPVWFLMLLFEDVGVCYSRSTINTVFTRHSRSRCERYLRGM